MDSSFNKSIRLETLTRSEEAIMQAIWKLKQGFLGDILAQMHEPRPHGNTVATILKVMVAKGFVKYEVQGRNNLYKPLISKDEYGYKIVSKILKGYYEGSAQKLVAHLVKEKRISAKELEELLRISAGREQDK